MDPEDREVIESLLRLHDPSGGREGPLPDEALLAGFVEGRLAPETRRAVEALLRESAAGRALAVELARVHEEDRATAGPRPEAGAPVLPWRRLAIAAVLLVALGVGIWAAGRGASPTARDVEARLLAASRALAGHAPDLFEGVEPLDAGERAAPVVGVLRGGLRVLLPAERTLATRPSLRWEAVPGATHYTLVVLDEQGQSVHTAASSRAEAAFPPEGTPLARGATYVCEVTAVDAPLGRVSGRRAFRVASAKEVERVQRAARLIAEHTAPDLRDLLLAHVALRWGHLAEAEQHLGTYLARHADDRVAKETSRYLVRRIGSAATD